MLLKRVAAPLVTFTNTKTEWTARAESMSKDSFYTESIARLPSDLERIRKLPQVEHVTCVDGGLHVHTREIVIAHEGTSYSVGSFILRVGKNGGIAIWPKRTTHPEGIPHPHIAKDGGPCYGNATDAITKAAADFRIADVVQYVLTWLQHGYTPGLAEHKLAEWTACPNRKAGSNGSERLASTQDRAAGGHATDDGHRGRVRRVKGRARVGKPGGDRSDRVGP